MWSSVGIVIVLFVAILFFKRLGNAIPILEFMLILAGLQWIIGPLIDYSSDYHHFKYYMYVEKENYMSYVVPAYCLYTLFVLYGLNKMKNISVDIDALGNYSKYGIILLVLGILFGFLKSVVPMSLAFVFFLLSSFKFVGGLILLFSKIKWHRYLFFGVIFFLLIQALRSALFHDFLIWSTFFYMFWAFKNKTKLKLNILIIAIGFSLGTIIQVVKSDYRDLIWEGYNGNYTSLFLEVLNKRISGGLADNTEQQSELNVRLNQGWIISAIMEYTPRVQPHANGETVKDAVFASVLPRFLNPNKKMAGGVENFKKYTGLTLDDNTSMGMSLVGEAYANYGRLGGVFFLMIWGLFLGVFWIFLIKKVNKNVIILFFLPLIFYQVVKAETELVVVLNHLIKSTVLVFGFLWLSKNVLRLNFQNE
jgi:hypothetical protein|nr:hypothetical protein [uncultured Psychroserpens sp.]